MKKLLTALAAAAALTTAAAQAADTVTVAATAVPHAELLEFVKPALAKEGVDLQIKVFTDYVQPNVQVAEKRLDANFFQHQPYLDEFNAARGTHLVSIAGVHVEPFGAYSKKIKTLADLPDGANVVIPNDATNGGRDNVMVDNLLKIDAECQRLAAVLDGGGEGGNTLTFVAGVVVNDAVPTDPQYDWGFISPTMVPPLPLAYGTQTGGATDKVFMITTGQMGPIGNPAPASKRIAFGAHGAADDGLSSVVLTTPTGSYTFEPTWMDGGSLAYWGFNGFDVTELPALLEGETFTVELVYA